MVGQTTGTMSMGGGATTRAAGKNSVTGISVVTSSELTEQECTRLGGDVTANSDPNCKSNLRCKVTLNNGDIRSICIDEVSN